MVQSRSLHPIPFFLPFSIKPPLVSIMGDKCWVVFSKAERNIVRRTEGARYQIITSQQCTGLFLKQSDELDYGPEHCAAPSKGSSDPFAYCMLSQYFQPGESALNASIARVQPLASAAVDCKSQISPSEHRNAVKKQQKHWVLLSVDVCL